jgi:hypothetical protein
VVRGGARGRLLMRKHLRTTARDSADRDDALNAKAAVFSLTLRHVDLTPALGVLPLSAKDRFAGGDWTIKTVPTDSR